MQDFNMGKIEVGTKALVIGCNYPENSYIIGKTVVVEQVLDRDDCGSPKIGFLSDRGLEFLGHGGFKENEVPGLVVFSGDFESSVLYKDGFGMIQRKFLMPLDDNDLQNELDKEENPYKVEEPA